MNGYILTHPFCQAQLRFHLFSWSKNNNFYVQMCILYSCWESSIFSEGTKSRALLLNAVNEWGRSLTLLWIHFLLLTQLWIGLICIKVQWTTANFADGVSHNIKHFVWYCHSVHSFLCFNQAFYYNEKYYIFIHNEICFPSESKSKVGLINYLLLINHIFHSTNIHFQ